MAKMKMILSFNEETMDLAAVDTFPAEKSEGRFCAHVRTRIREILGVDEEEAAALMYMGDDQGVFYGVDEGTKALHAAIMFPGGEGCEYLQLADAPEPPAPAPQGTREYLLTGIWQDEFGQVSARTPETFDAEDDAVTEAKRQLAEDFGITIEDVEELAQEGGTPYVLSLAKDGSFEAFTISQVQGTSGAWSYEIRDAETQKVLMAACGFRTEADARTQAQMEKDLRNIKGCCIHVAASLERKEGTW